MLYLLVDLTVISLVDFNLLIQLLQDCCEIPVSLDNSTLPVKSCPLFIVSPFHFVSLWLAESKRWINK